MENTHLILAAGMPRSASTWLYNAARILISESKSMGEDFSCGWIGDIENIPHKKHMLIKLHDFDQELVEQASYVMYSYRDIRDAMASNFRKFGEQPCIAEADYLVNQYEKWTSIADLVMKYEAMIKDKDTIIMKLGEGLGIKSFNTNEVVKKIEESSYNSLGDKNERYHKTNLYHHEHMTDGRQGSWQGTLDPDFITQVEVKYKKWFLAAGYH